MSIIYKSIYFFSLIKLFIIYNTLTHINTKYYLLFCILQVYFYTWKDSSYLTHSNKTEYWFFDTSLIEFWNHKGTFTSAPHIKIYSFSIQYTVQQQRKKSTWAHPPERAAECIRKPQLPRRMREKGGKASRIIGKRDRSARRRTYKISPALAAARKGAIVIGEANAGWRPAREISRGGFSARGPPTHAPFSRSAGKSIPIRLDYMGFSPARAWLICLDGCYASVLRGFFLVETYLRRCADVRWDDGDYFGARCNARCLAKNCFQSSFRKV